MKCFLDMDGVVADIVLGMCHHFKVANPFDDPAYHGPHTYNLMSIVGKGPELWADLGFGFWADLPETSEAAQIVDLVTQCFGVENVCILSRPTSNIGCMAGKRMWIERHFPQFANQFLFGIKKEFCASETALLIDDTQENVKAFEDAGGLAFLVPRPWNDRHADEPQLVTILREFLSYGRFR